MRRRAWAIPCTIRRPRRINRSRTKRMEQGARLLFMQASPLHYGSIRDGDAGTDALGPVGSLVHLEGRNSGVQRWLRKSGERGHLIDIDVPIDEVPGANDVVQKEGVVANLDS